MREALWFLLGGSLSFNFFLCWKLFETQEELESWMDVPLERDEDRKDG